MISILRSPFSYFDTNDWGLLSRAASLACVKLASSRHFFS